MDIGEAIAQLTGGHKVRREQWPPHPYGPDFLYLVGGSVFNVNRKPLLGIFNEGDEIQYRAHIDALYIDPANGRKVAKYYDFTQTDIMAQDWVIVETKKPDA